jgi:transcriptional regulator with GAF, ATPase, and Fis domain
VFAAMAADNKKPGVMGETDLESTLIRGEGNAAAETVTSIGSKPENAASILSAGIQDITNTLVSEYQLNDLLSMIMETMFRGMGFARVLLVLRDVRSGLMAGRFALGEDSDNLVRQFSFPLTGNPDLFRLAVSQGRDILISDARAEKVQAQLPEWYLSHIHAPAFVLFPILVGKNPVGLIYADMLGQASLKIAREEANLLVTLRNQAVLAFKNAATR